MTGRAGGRVDGKVAVVTGAGAGSGEAVARELAAEGAAVLVADIAGESAERVAAAITADGGRALAHQVDLGDPEGVEGMVAAAVAAFGALHVLHNNASERANVATDNRVVETDLAVWQRQFDVDLTAPLWASRCAIPHMVAAGSGSIIHTSSLAARAAQDSRTAYGTAKAGLLGLSRAIAVQYGKQGVRSNVILPGAVLTPTLRRLWDPEHLRVYADHTMTPELGTPQDIAKVVLFFASDDSRYVTGQELTVDGGLSSYIAVVPAYREIAARAAGASGG